MGLPGGSWNASIARTALAATAVVASLASACLHRDGHGHFAPMALQPIRHETFVVSGQVLALADDAPVAGAWVCAYRDATPWASARADIAGRFVLRGPDTRRVTHHTISMEDHEHYPIELVVGAPELVTRRRSLELPVPVSPDREPLQVRLLAPDADTDPAQLSMPDDCALAEAPAQTAAHDDAQTAAHDDAQTATHDDAQTATPETARTGARED